MRWADRKSKKIKENGQKEKKKRGKLMRADEEYRCPSF